MNCSNNYHGNILARQLFVARLFVTVFSNGVLPKFGSFPVLVLYPNIFVIFSLLIFELFCPI